MIRPSLTLAAIFLVTWTQMSDGRRLDARVLPLPAAACAAELTRIANERHQVGLTADDVLGPKGFCVEVQQP